MLNPLDIKILRRGLIPLGLGVALALCLVIPSQLYYVKQNESVELKRRTMLSAQTRYNTAKEATQIIKQYLPSYQKYVSHGVIGNENRLSWIEALRSWTIKRGLDTVQYSVDARQVWSLSMIPESGEMDVRRSAMQTSVNVLHEGDVFDFWDHLNRYANGLYSVKECEIRRLVDKIDVTSIQPTLATRCLLHWLTVDVPGASQGEM